jgi:hypothetical protein
MTGQIFSEVLVDGVFKLLPGTKYVFGAIQKVPLWNCVICECFEPYDSLEFLANSFGQSGVCSYNEMLARGETPQAECL